ncbi:hypothetical protein QAD02_018341 [Eretmocerus hayati]|uniref:Uncharacterized protein n=1 Tax=Eretmocerus hayati TaxID=131215 RepID=A0ACC2PIX7_9HYME|nr:hypothetical protein QAD02_018341 [Eretmocerus hayati]
MLYVSLILLSVAIVTANVTPKCWENTVAEEIFPYHAYINCEHDQHSNLHQWYGVIISDRWILSVIDYFPSEEICIYYTAHVGAPGRNSSSYYIWPTHKRGEITLFQTRDPMNFSMPQVQPIKMRDSFDFTYTGQPANLTELIFEKDDKKSNAVYAIEVVISPEKSCRDFLAAYGRRTQLKEGFICSNHPKQVCPSNANSALVLGGELVGLSTNALPIVVITDNTTEYARTYLSIPHHIAMIKELTGI